MLFIMGALIGFGFNCFSTLSDLEAVSFWGDDRDVLTFNHEVVPQAELISLDCPVFISPDETGSVTASIRNNPKNQKDILVKAAVSHGDLRDYRIVNGQVPLNSEMPLRYAWQVDRHDTIDGKVLLTRVFLMDSGHTFPIPARTKSCGVFVLDLFGLSGRWIEVLFVGISLICLTIGCLLLKSSKSRLKDSFPRLDHGLFILAGMIAFGMLADLLGWWIPAGLVLLLTILFTIVMIPSILQHKGN